MPIKEMLSETDAQEIIERVASQTEGFVPDTADKVDWVLSKVAAARSEAAAIRDNGELMAREKDREAEALLWKFGPSLQEYLRLNLGGKKSLRFFHGVIGTRTKPAGITFDDAAARAWAMENAADTLRLDRRALEAALTISETGKAIVKDTGEVLTFATVSPAEEVFYVK